MAELVACPNCERKLKVPAALLGKRVKCPECQGVFTAAAAPARPSKPGAAEKKAPPAPARKPAHDDDDDGPQQYDVATQEAAEEEDGTERLKPGLLEQHFRQQQLEDERLKRGKRPFMENWRKARLGVHLVSLAAFILLANLLVMTLGRGIIYLVTRPDDLEPTPTAHQIAAHKQRVADAEVEKKGKQRYLTSAVAIIFLLHQVVALAGIGLCLLSPDKNNMRLLAAGALVLALGSLGLEVGCSIAPLQYLISGMPDTPDVIPPPHAGLRLATDLVGYLRFFVLLFFMRAVAVTTKSDELKREVLILMIALGIMIVFWLVMATITAVKLPADLKEGVGGIVMQGSLIGVIGMGSLGLMVAGVLWFTMTAHTTTVAITDWLRER